MKGKTLIAMAIEALIFEGGEGNAIILRLGTDYYVQFASRKGAYEVYCEAICNTYIENEDAVLTEKQMGLLRRLGWKDPVGEGNFYQVHAVDSETSRKKLTKVITETILRVYGINEIREEDFVISLA